MIRRLEKLAALFENGAGRPLAASASAPTPAEFALITELGNLSDRAIDTRFRRMTAATAAKLTGQPGPRGAGRPREIDGAEMIELLNGLRASMPPDVAARSTDAMLLRVHCATMDMAIKIMLDAGVTIDWQRIASDPAYADAMEARVADVNKQLAGVLTRMPDAEAEPFWAELASHLKWRQAGTDRYAKMSRRRLKAMQDAVTAERARRRKQRG